MLRALIARTESDRHPEGRVTDFRDLIPLLEKNTAGVQVNESSAHRATAVWACIRVISEDTASLPLGMYEQLAPRGKKPAPQHPLHTLLHRQPNPEMTALQFREAITAHVLAWGNAYVYIVRDNRDVPRELWPLLPDRTVVKRDARTLELVYETEAPNTDQRFALRPDQVLHIAGLGFDGRVGYSPIAMHRQAVGLALAAEEFGARFFGQGTNLGGFISHPGTLSQPAYERLKNDVNRGLAAYRGLDRSHLWMILEEGSKPEKIGIPPDEAQFIETRKFSVAEIARIFRVPPHKIQDLDRATFSNIEHQALDYVTSTLRPWLERWEQAIGLRLIAPAERQRFFAKHKVEGLLRGDIATRYASYAQARQWGWLSVNDIRELEDMNPVDDGDVYLQPMNMRPADAPPPLPTPAPALNGDRGTPIPEVARA